MNESVKNTKLMRCLVIANILCMLVGVILSVISSNKAYSLSDINKIVSCGSMVIILDLVVLIFEKKMKKQILMDLIHFMSSLLITAALCLMISGRVLLMGYIYFSDLETGNPIAVSAMNLAVVSWIFYILALIIHIVIGFKKD